MHLSVEATPIARDTSQTFERSRRAVRALLAMVAPMSASYVPFCCPFFALRIISDFVEKACYGSTRGPFFHLGCKNAIGNNENL